MGVTTYSRGSVYMRLHPEGRKRLAKLILIQEVSHRQVAAAAGWRSHGMVRFLLTGERTSVSPTSAVALAKFFGVEVSDLFLTEVSSVPRQATSGTVRRSA